MKIQNRGMRIVRKCNRRMSVIMTLQINDYQQQIAFNTLDLIYKLRYNMLPYYLIENIQLVNEIHDYDTKRLNDSHVEKFNTTF